MRRKQGGRDEFGKRRPTHGLKEEFPCFQRRCFHLYVMFPTNPRIKRELRRESVRMKRKKRGVSEGVLGSVLTHSLKACELVEGEAPTYERKEGGPMFSIKVSFQVYVGE
jgi:hypothetical protein